MERRAKKLPEIWLHPSMWGGEGPGLPTDPIMHDVRGLPPGHEEMRIRLKAKGWTIETRQAENGKWVAKARCSGVPSRSIGARYGCNDLRMMLAE